MSKSPFFGERKYLEINIPLNKTPVESVLSSNDDRAQIVLGGDRTRGPETGYSGKGFQDSAAIDMVVGRAKTLDAKSKQDAKFVNPDFFTDAARIYISEKADIDSYFEIVDGFIGSKRSGSAIALKADSVRIIGIEGIKLVTRANPTNSNGADLGVAGIELIAGNDDSNLQSMVKGENLVDCLTDMLDTISNIKAQVNSVVDLVYQLVKNYAQHVHAPPGSSPSPQAIELNIKNAIEVLRHEMEDNSLSSDISAIKSTYFEVPSQDQSILSPYNKTN